MIIFVANAARRASASAPLGDFITPGRWSHTLCTKVWAADNGAFSGLDEDAFRRMLDHLAEAETKPAFVTVPDVVCDHVGTVEKYLTWAREFRDRQLPRAFVLQNGIEQHPPEFGPPWDCLDALFIGGDTAFKFTAWVREAVRLAKSAGKWVHMGRVNW